MVSVLDRGFEHYGKRETLRLRMEPPRDSFARASLGQMMKDPIDAFFATYPPAVRELAASVRAFVRSTIPDASETLDEPGRVVGYGIGAGYSGLVCTIIPSKAGVKLGVVRGAQLSDPRGLLEGSGKQHRYVQINRLSDVERAGIADLLEAAREAATTKRGV